MPSSDRHKQKRTLGFEHLESKTSPAAIFTGMAWVEVPQAAAVAPQQHQLSAGFLEYVAATLKDIRIERAMPTQADASAADRMLASETPDTT